MESHFDITPPPEGVPPPALEGTIPPPAPEHVEQEVQQEREEPAVEMEVSERYDEDELEELELPELPEKKAKLTNDEVFAPPSVKPVKEDKPVKEKKPRKKRKPMTPEQLERLAEGRKKAFAVKAQKKKERDEMKALQKKVEEKKKAKQHQEIMDELSDDEIPETMKKQRPPKKVAPPPTQSIMPSLTQEDLMMAVAQGVESYDRKRKAEKAKKKERQAVEARDNEIKQKVQRAVSVNPWDQFLK